MSNVWDAMKKHQAEQAEQPDQQAPAPPQQTPEPHQGPAAAPKAARTVKKAGADGRYSELLVVHADRGSAITEEYRSVRTSLLARCRDGRFCYLVTSPNAGEGKTITCLNLALVMAECVDRRTIVVDSDLRKGKMARFLHARPAPGMADLLRGSAALSECVQPMSYPNLFFLPAGKASETEAAELVGRPELDEIVSQLRREYDYVIFDTPPINVTSEAGILGRAAGQALLVVRMNRTRRESVDKAIRLLHAANVELSGIILTHRKYYIPSYLYRYS